MDAKEQKNEFRGMNARERMALEEKQKEKKTRVKYGIIAAIIVIFVAVVIVVNSSIFTNKLTALKVNDTAYTVADGNYAYQDSYMTFSNQYSSLMSYILDPNKSLKEQECGWDENSVTWHDYFKNSAKENLRQTTAFYDAAVKAGYTVTDEDRAEVDETLSTLSTYATVYGYTLDGYLGVTYGNGNNEKTVRAQLEKSAVVQNYLADLFSSFTYTDADKEAYYKENYKDLTNVKFHYFYIDGTADEENGITAEDAMAAAKEQADAIKAAIKEDTVEAFDAAVLDVTGEEASESSYTVSSFLSAYEGSVTENEIKAGSSFVHTGNAGAYVVCVTEIDENDYHTVSVRHILVKAVDEDGDGEYSDAEKKTAYDKLVAIRDEWLAGAADENSFAQLATLKSEDTGSQESGGLYENICKGQMVPEFNDFCFAEHQPGDYDIVMGDTTATAGENGYVGYHLIYFVGADGELYSNTLAESNLRSKDYTDATTALLEGYTATETGMWRFVMK